MLRLSASAYRGLVVASSLVAAAINAGPALQAQTQAAPAAGTSMMVGMMDAVNAANDSESTRYRASVTKAQPVSASAAPAPSLGFNPAATSGPGGPLAAMVICFSNPPPSGPNHNTEYLTAAFEVPIAALGAPLGLESAFADYLKATYHVRLQVTCQPIWSVTDARTVQKKIAGARDSAKLNMVDTGWRYQQPPLAQGQGGFDPLALGPGGLDLSQHRLTTYFCSVIARGGTSMAQTDPALANQVNYVSPVFEADWDSAPVDRDFDVYIRDHYVHDLSLSDTSQRCSAQSPDMQSMMHQRAMISSTDNGHAVPVDFTDTPAQAAAGNAAATQMTAAAAAAPKLGPREYYVFCISDPSAPVMYFSDVFVATADPPRGNMRGVSFRNIGDNFPVFLQQKYSVKSSTSCLGGAKESAPTQGLKQQLEDQYKKANKQIVETGWKNQ